MNLHLVHLLIYGRGIQKKQKQATNSGAVIVSTSPLITQFSPGCLSKSIQEEETNGKEDGQTICKRGTAQLYLRV